MDTSKEYIEMCQKAGEIQRQWNEDTRQEGDFFAENNSTYVYYCCPEEDTLTYVDYPVWLPRQDQLQEMTAIGNLHSMGYAVRRVDNKDTTTDYWVQLRSLEQFWLTYAMMDLHNKFWDGSEWKTTNERGA